MTAKSAIPLFLSHFIFLRHGETETNRLGLIAGSTDVELNETGHRQARHAAGLLKMHGVDAVYSSPLRRARDTASCVAAALGLAVTVVPELAERNWGELEGRPRDMRTRATTPRGGESPAEFSARTLAGLKKIAGSALPLVVAHSGTFRVLGSALKIGVPSAPINNSQPMRLIPPPTSDGCWTIGII